MLRRRQPRKKRRESDSKNYKNKGDLKKRGWLRRNFKEKKKRESERRRRS